MGVKRKEWLWLAALVLGVAITTWLARDAEPPTRTEPVVDRYDVELNCERVVRDNLVSPATMRVAPGNGASSLGAGAWRYEFEVDSQNSFGALIRSRWSCFVTGDNVTVEQLQR